MITTGQKKYRKSSRGRQKTKDYKAKHRQQIVDFVVDYKKTHCCESCGESRFICLDFHHRDRNKKSFAISEAVQNHRGLARIKIEISKCMVICANCHRVLHAFDKESNLNKDQDDTDELSLFA